MYNPGLHVPIYALFCSEFPERERALRNHFWDRGITATFWRGFGGTQWGLETSKEYDPGKRISSGHVGLNLGAWAMWQHALLQGDGLPGSEAVIFFEDDVELPEDFYAKIATLRTELDTTFPDWDLVFIGTCGTEPAIWHKVTERIGGPDSRLCRLSNPFGTHAMMVRRRTIPVLLEHMRAAERNLDQQLWQRVLQPGYLKWCAVLPTLVHQRTYDNKGIGTPEWAPSTLRPEEMSNKPAPVPEPTGGDLPGRPSAETTAATLAVIDPYPCAYRGEALEDHGRAMTQRRPVPLSECARLNRTCHSKSAIGTVIDQSGAEAVSCEICPHRNETIPTGNRERLPLPEGHFNCGMIPWGSRLILATRDSWGHSKVALWDLKNDKPDWTGRWACRPIGSFKSGHPEAPRLEDPRLFKFVDSKGRPRIYAAFSLPDNYPPKVVKVGYCRFDLALTEIDETVILESPHGNLYEKNWSPLVTPDGLHWVYAMKPNHVVMGPHQNFVTENPFQWTGGVMRGGATPIYHNGEYYSFFHGCLKRAQGNVYSVGVYTFQPFPPFRILRQTPTPILWPDAPAHDEAVVKRMVLFPGGVVAHAGAWHLAMGVDDTFCRIERLPFDRVEEALSRTTRAERDVSSIRDTHIAHGVTAEEFK